MDRLKRLKAGCFCGLWGWLVLVCLAGWSPARERSLHGHPGRGDAVLSAGGMASGLQRRLAPKTARHQWEGVFRAAWEAYGHDAAEADHVLREVQQVVQQFRNLEAATGPKQGRFEAAPARAFALCRLLHRRWLRRYRLSATDPHRAWRAGEYNCVSGTLFYCLAASYLGWSVRVRELPEHVQAAVQVRGGRWQAVEVTLADGVPPAGKRQRALRVLSPRQFQAVVFYNRAIDAAERGLAERAIGWNRRAWALDPANENIRNNLVATVNNHALELAQQGELARAEQLLQQLVRLVPDHPVVRQNLRYVAQRRRRQGRSAGPGSPTSGPGTAFSF